MLIEQAVFTSVRTDRADGYQLAAISPGVAAADARELTVWGPTQEALCGTAQAPLSVNFHPLPSGAWGVGYSRAAGAEFSGRGGALVYTQSLIVTSDVLARFANNPFALLRAARAKDLLAVQDPLPAVLAPLQLPGRAAPFDDGLVGELVDRLGPRRLAWLLQAALSADALVLVNAENADWLLAGLLNCLPVECRGELSFATGLNYSQRRPYRINAVVADIAECRRLARQPGVTLLDLAAAPLADFEPSGWAAYVAQAAEADRLAWLAAELSRPRPGLRLSDLAWLAEQLTQRLETSSTPPSPPLAVSRHAEETWAETDEFGHDDSREVAGGYRQAHAAHPRFAGTPQKAGVETAATVPGPSAALAHDDPELLEKLERLDDVVFDTIGGKQPALDELTVLWPQLAGQLPSNLLHESREQYLRYALTLWESCLTDGIRDPQWAVAALDVLCVLFNGEG